MKYGRPNESTLEETRMHKKNRIRAAFPALVLLVGSGLLCGRASAQLNSNSSTVTLNASLLESLTISASPATVNFSLVSGAAATGSAPVAIQTTWLLLPTRANVKLFAWFATPAAALTDGATTPNNIPSSEVFGQVTSGTPTSFTAFTQSNTLGAANGGLLLFTQALSALNRAATRSDNLNLKIDLTSQPQLPAGTFTGTLNIQAQAL
jgi:hypothetical protein